MQSPLVLAITALRDAAAQRALLDRRIRTQGAETFADEVEALLVGARAGYVDARTGALVLASWLVHHRAVSLPSTALVPSRAPLVPSSALVALQASSSEVGRPLLSALLREGEAAATLAKGGRLGEISLPASAIDSAPPTHAFISESTTSAASIGARAEARTAALLGETHPEDIALLSMDVPSGPYVVRPPLAIDSARFFYGRGATGTLEPLRMHHRPRVVEKLLDQRWLRLRDVVLIAARRPTVPALAWAIASRDRWFFQAPVREALAQNPFSPTSLVLALLPTVATSTVQRLVRLGAPEVRDAAKLFA